MDVYLVPIGADLYELYYEAPADAPHDLDDDRRRSWWSRAVARFRALLAEAEEDRRRREDGDAAAGRGLWRAMLRRVAEAVAEQRLLWHLRQTESGRLRFPGDLSGDRALELLRAALGADFRKHRRWLVIDAALFLASVPLTVIPGPNVPALFFSFRVFGHFLSLTGARRGLDRVVWHTAPSAELEAVRAALTLPHRERLDRLDKLSTALGLLRLPAFIERTRRS
jgi:hypothetical protein